MGRWRILAVDLDGTLSSDGATVNEAVRRSLREAEAAGVRVILATGRPAASAIAFARELELRTPVICYQGAMICQPEDGSPLYERTMDIQVALDALRWGREHDRHLLLFADGSMWVDRRLHPYEVYYRWMGLPIRIAPRLDDLVASGQVTHVYKLIDFLPREEWGIPDRTSMWREVLDGPVCVVRSHEMFVELMSPEATKGNALAWLAERWQIPRDQILAVGDSENDLSMIRWAGMGVAMGQAAPDVLAEADWVAPPVEKDGVAWVVRRFILNGASHG
ncbi:MAG: Cof-type HAD-IIB family hydrolase [Anaerolineae bacterium]